MNNFQLYNTNILLGGLVCWDLTINNIGDKACVSDFLLNPINHNILFFLTGEHNWLEFSHEKNVLFLYDKIHLKFFEGSVDPLLLLESSIFEKKGLNDEHLLRFDKYNTGCERNDFLITNKNYEILCPVWLEHLLENDLLSFDVIIKDLKGGIIGTLNVPFGEIKNKNIHNGFVKYFNEYIENSKIINGNDDLIEIDFKNDVVTVNGLNVNNAEFVSCEDYNMVDELISEELPMMKLDEKIINCFKNNEIICNQLFNFRFHFNLEDIINPSLLNLMPWQSVNVSIQVKINDEILDCMDLYTNYDFILKIQQTTPYSENINNKKINVFDYLKDYESLAGENKIYSPIIHWSLNGNNNYLFNLYDGFSGYFVINDNVYFNTGLYGNSANVYKEYFDLEYNNLSWCNNYILNNDLNNLELISRINLHVLKSLTIEEFFNFNAVVNLKLPSVFNTNKTWINNIKYDFQNKKLDELKIMTLVLDEDLMQEFNEHLTNLSGFDVFMKTEYLQVIYNKKFNVLYFVSICPDSITLYSVKEMLNEKSIKNNDILFLLKNYLNSMVLPWLVEFYEKIIPTKSILEFNFSSVSYVKKYKKFLILRYDGKIKPTFLPIEKSEKYNDLYIINKFQENDDCEEYEKYINNNVSEVYPLNKYYYIKKLKLDYSTPIKDLQLKPEYKWFNNSRVIYIPNNLFIDFDIVKKPDEGVYIDEFEKTILDKLFELYGINKENKPYIGDIPKNDILNYYNYFILNDSKKIENENIKYSYNIKLNVK